MLAPKGMKKTMTASLPALLLDWFARLQRPLPWRGTYDAYHVWLSEIMLQQTQMDRAVVYFQRFTARFPHVGALAEGSEEEVLRLWEGLGYYSRARNLLKAAKAVMERHAGRFPDDLESLGKLPGVGAYTAGAVRSIAFNLPATAVDANVVRVLARVYDLAEPVKDPAVHKRITALAAGLVPEGRAREFNQALMELGALVCRPRAPLCDQCPLADICLALARGTVALRPVKAAPKAVTPIGVGTGVILHEGLFFIQKRRTGGVWGGLWEFPGGQMEPGETPEQTAVREMLEETGFVVRPQGKLAVIQHSYTRYRVTLHAYLMSLPEGTPPLPQPELNAASAYKWTTLDALESLSFPSPHRKLIEILQRDARLVGENGL